MDLENLKNPESYVFWSNEIVRFADLDRLNHVNNVSFATYSESSRVHFLETLTPGCTEGHGTGWVIAKLVIHYLAAAYYPGDVKIGILVDRIGNSSISVKQGMFQNNKCFSVVESILVWADTKNEKSVPLPDLVRKELEKYHHDSALTV